MTSGETPRLHGEETLHDPKLIEEGCSRCQKKTQWKVEERSDGSVVKTCTNCGLKTLSKPVIRDKPKKKKENVLSLLSDLFSTKK